MTLDRLTELHNTVKTDIGRRRYFSAISRLKKAFGDDPMLRMLLTRLERIAETYGYLVKFLLAGTDDPTRAEMLRSISTDLMSLLDEARRIVKTENTPTLYYSTLRTIRHRDVKTTIPELIASYRDKASEYSLVLFTDPDASSDKARSLKAEMERIGRDFFVCVWTAYPLTIADENVLKEMMSDSVVGPIFKSLAVGALFLGLLEAFDIRRLEVLMSAYSTAEREIALRALLVMLMSFTLVDEKSLEPLRSQLTVLADDRQWKSDVETVFRQFLNSRDTDRINRKFTDEIIPTMKNIGEDLKKKMRDIDPNDPDALENSDELAELMENSGFADKMRQMSEIQEQGGDILLSTFSHLKGFPFFRTISNWFIPYHSDQTDVASALKGMSTVGEMLASTPALCDSDRFSIALSMSQLPEAQRTMFMTQLEAQSRQMAEIQASAMNSGSLNDKAVIGNYAHTLYRFFKLYERAGEFDNPFATSLNLLGVGLLDPTLAGTGLEEEAAFFYYTHGYYSDALPLLLKIQNSVAPDRTAMVYFSIADCYYRLNDHENALTYFERSELFDEKNRDTLVRIALLHRENGNHKKAVEYLRRSLQSNDKTLRKLRSLLASELLAVGDFRSASDILYEFEYKGNITDQQLRDLARCEYESGNFDKARESLMKAKITGADDYILRAEMDLIERKYENAVSMLSLAVTTCGLNPAVLIERTDRLIPAMAEKGVERDVVEVVRDEALRRTVSEI